MLTDEEPQMTIMADGTRMWYLNGRRHRTDGPAIEFFDGDRQWYLNGQMHRTDGPAIELVDGRRYWFLNDRSLTFNAWLRVVAQTDEERMSHLMRWG